MSTEGIITVHSDGGSRGNPGPAAIGVVIEIGSEKREIAKYIGEATNNQAEYQAVIVALTWIKENHKEPNVKVELLIDSELVVEQLNQRYKIKNEGLKPFFWQIRDLIMDLGGQVVFRHVNREENKEADKLVNKALDEAAK